MTKKILHIVVGDESWLPTKKQLRKIGKLFKKARKDPEGSVVVTHPGISVSTIEMDESIDTVIEKWKAPAGSDRDLIKTQELKEEQTRPVYTSKYCDVKEGCTIRVNGKLYASASQVIVNDIHEVLDRHVKQHNNFSNEDWAGGYQPQTKSVFDQTVATVYTQGIINLSSDIKFMINGVIYDIKPDTVHYIKELLTRGVKGDKGD